MLSTRTSLIELLFHKILTLTFMRMFSNYRTKQKVLLHTHSCLFSHYEISWEQEKNSITNFNNVRDWHLWIQCVFWAQKKKAKISYLYETGISMFVHWYECKFDYVHSNLSKKCWFIISGLISNFTWNFFFPIFASLLFTD